MSATDVSKIVGNLEAKNVTLSLAIDFEGDITPEAEKLLQELSQNKQAAIDVLAGRRFAPLPDNTPHPFRSERLMQIRSIFAVCYRMLEKFEGIEDPEQWRKAATYYEGRLGNDALSVDMFTVCYNELQRQYYKGKEKHYDT